MTVHAILRRQKVVWPIERVFGFFADAGNLDRLERNVVAGPGITLALVCSSNRPESSRLLKNVEQGLRTKYTVALRL